VCKDYGADITISEMALSSALLRGKSGEWAMIRRHPCEDVYGVQIAGCHPEILGKTCEAMEEAGIKADFIDLNCCCPLTPLCKKGIGSGMLYRPNSIGKSLQGKEKEVKFRAR